MSEHEQPPPMDADLRALLRGTRTAYDGEANRHLDGALARLAQALPESSAPHSDPQTPPSHVDGAATTAVKLGMAKLAGPVIGSVLAGSLLGAAVTSIAMPVRERVVYVERRVIVAASASTVPPSIRVDDLPTTPKAVVTAAAPVSSGSDVSAERLMLDEARTAFASGDYAKSLDRLERHKARFPFGTLSEEREALAVRALAAGGNKTEAARRGRAFVAKYPDSIMRPAVESAVQDP